MLILAPTAGSVPAETNAGYIVRIAKSLGATLLVVHITPTEATKDGLKALEIFNSEAEKAGVEIRTDVVQDGVVAGILTTADKEKVDLIVMGASHGVVVHEWLATNLLNKSKIPVVIIPQGAKAVVVTLGRRGAMAITAEQIFSIPPFNANVVDTTGAGDAFCGAFAVAYAQEKDLKKATRFAAAAGALACNKFGGQASLPHRALIQRLLQRSC